MAGTPLRCARSRAPPLESFVLPRVLHVVTHPGDKESWKRCSRLCPLLHRAELSQGVASTQLSSRSRRTPSTVPLYIDTLLAMPLLRESGCLASCAIHERLPSQLHGAYRCCEALQLERSLR
nr:unnamed protein product [Leishmania braziliensis]